jgi:hypothetical protein
MSTYARHSRGLTTPTTRHTGRQSREPTCTFARSGKPPAFAFLAVSVRRCHSALAPADAVIQTWTAQLNTHNNAVECASCRNQRRPLRRYGSSWSLLGPTQSDWYPLLRPTFRRSPMSVRAAHAHRNRSPGCWREASRQRITDRSPPCGRVWSVRRRAHLEGHARPRAMNYRLSRLRLTIRPESA